MTKINYISISLIFLLIISCSKNITEKKITVEKNMELQINEDDLEKAIKILQE